MAGSPRQASTTGMSPICSLLLNTVPLKMPPAAREKMTQVVSKQILANNGGCPLPASGILRVPHEYGRGNAVRSHSSILLATPFCIWETSKHLSEAF